MMKWHFGNQEKAKQRYDHSSIPLLDHEFLQKKSIPSFPMPPPALIANNLQFTWDPSLLNCLITTDGHHLLKTSVCWCNAGCLVAVGPHSLVARQDPTACSKCPVTHSELETKPAEGRWKHHYSEAI